MYDTSLNWRKGWFLSATFLLLFLVTTSCKKQNHTLGQDVLDPNELLTSGGTDTFQLVTSSFSVDSMITDNIGYGILGSYNDPVFGKVNAEIYTQFRLLTVSPIFDDLNQITIDSVVLGLEYRGMYGKTGDQTVEVYEIGGTEALHMDSTYYSFTTFPTTGGNLVVPGKEVLNMNPGNTTIIDTNEVEPQLRIHLDTNLGWNLLNETVNNPASFESNDAFVDFFKGLKIKTNNGQQSSGEGGLFYFSMSTSNSKLTVYYKSAGVSRTFDIVLNSSSSDFNHIDIQQSSKVQQVLDTPSEGQKTFYAQSFRSRALVKIPGLENIPSNAIVHSAQLELPVAYQSGQPYDPGVNLSSAVFTSSTDSTLLSTGSVAYYDEAAKQFTLDLRDYVQAVINGDIENTGIVVSPLLFVNSGDRIIFNGPESTNKMKPRFSIVYTEY